MFQGGDWCATLSTGVAEGAATAEAILRMHIEPYGVWLATGFPALWTKLQDAGLLDGNTFVSRL